MNHISKMATNNIQREDAASCDHEEDDSKIFPQRLMEILDDESNHEAISWLPHGKAFIVRKRDLFASAVMPKYFSRKTKNISKYSSLYSSFTRKLNRWCFRRVSSGPELGAYYHEFFLRDKPHLTTQMFCKNDRTMLAMASVAESPAHAVAQPSSASASAAPIPVTPALLAALTKEPSVHSGNNNNKLSNATPQFSTYAPGNLRLLELHLQQQEEANRILLQHAITLSQQQRQQQQEKMANQHARLIQMQQLMQLRQQQQNQRNANNHRASAA